MTWPFGTLRPFSYDVIVVEPAVGLRELQRRRHQEGRRPALRRHGPGRHQGAFRSATWRGATPSCSFSTGAMLPQALDVLNAWGAKYLSQIIWRKVTKNGKVRVGTGYRVRTCHEPVLLASFGGRQDAQAVPVDLRMAWRASTRASSTNSTRWCVTGRQTSTGAICSAGRPGRALTAGGTSTETERTGIPPACLASSH
jgi:hypothetical protein